jgi:hypothetical protein
MILAETDEQIRQRWARQHIERSRAQYPDYQPTPEHEAWAYGTQLRPTANHTDLLGGFEL